MGQVEIGYSACRESARLGDAERRARCRQGWCRRG